MYNNQPRWWTKDAILTDRGLYLYSERGDILGEQYDKLEMSQFKSHRVSNANDHEVSKNGGVPSSIGNANNRGSSNLNEMMMMIPAPAYVKQLPPFKAPYSHLIEMYNKKTCKRRIIACESASAADDFTNLLNLVNSFLNYEALIAKSSDENPKGTDQSATKQDDQNQSQNTPVKKRSQGGGPLFITNWVRNYLHHQGAMECSEEHYSTQNLPYLLAFGRETDAVRGLIFGESFGVLAATSPQQAEHDKRVQALGNILQTFNRETITHLVFKQNYLSDQIFKLSVPSIAQYTRLTTLEIVNNQLTNRSLEAMSVIFSNCPSITKLDLSNNLLGQGDRQQLIVEQFLNQLLTELDNPQYLNLSHNNFTDESLRPFLYYIFANEDLRLTFFSLEFNELFTPTGKRTLLKAYSLSPSKAQFQFKFGPVPFSESTLKHAFSVQAQNGSQMIAESPRKKRTAKIENSISPEMVGEQKGGISKHSASQLGLQQPPINQYASSKDKYELVITRRPNYSGIGLRNLPVNRAEREKLAITLSKLDQAVLNKQNLTIEDLRDLVQEVSLLDFEFPRHKLEPIFDVINEKMHMAIEGESIYCIEVLLEALRFMSARNIKAEDKYSELTLVAQGVARDIIRVLNMDSRFDDNELNLMLDSALDEAKRIGMRGEIIDVACTLLMMRNNLLQEMQNRTGNSDDEEDPQFMFFGGPGGLDEDKTMNVYDEKYDQYIDMPLEEMGLTTEVEPNLGLHPYSTNYLFITQMNVNYVRKNLKEAQKFLRDEECYAFRNIFDRAYFLTSENDSKVFQFAKNDTNLKMSRLIFRYKNNLDELFEMKQDPYYSNQIPSILGLSVNVNKRLSYTGGTLMMGGPASEDLLLYQYKHIQGKDQIEFNGTKVARPVTNKVDKGKTNVAVLFNKALFNLCESDYNLGDSASRATFAYRVQDMIETYVLKNSRFINEDLQDEFFLQIFRQMNRKNKQSSEKAAKAVTHALYMLVVLSRYMTPSRDLIDGYEAWLNILRDCNENDYTRLILQILSNLTTPKRPPYSQQQNLTSGGSQSGNDTPSQISIPTNIKPLVDWPPSVQEIDSLITGEPLLIQVHTPAGDSIFQYPVDETTTVEALLTQHVWKEKYFQKEPDKELYWLYRLVEGKDQFDQALPKDQKILKILYKSDKANGKRTESAASDAIKNALNANSEDRFKSTNKFLRKQTIAAQMESMQENWVDPQFTSTVFMIKKRIFSSLHIDKNVKRLQKKALNFLFHQVRMDYVEKNLLKRLSNYEDVSLFGALVMKIKYQGKILTSKDNSLTKNIVVKNIEYAIPATFLREKPQDYWVTKIQKDYEKNNLRDVSIEEAQEKFLNNFAQYSLAYSSYYVLRAQAEEGKSSNNISSSHAVRNMIPESDGGDNDDDIMSEGGTRVVDAKSKGTFLAQHMNHDLLCVINYNGISFYENQKRDKILQKIAFDELLYAMGSGDTLKLGYIARNQSKIIDAKIELFTTNGQSARPIAEDIIAYCQIKLAENTRNECIKVVNRNMNNLYEGIEDPFADDFILDSPPVLNKNASKGALRGGGKPGRRGGLGPDYEYFMDDGSQSVTPTNNNQGGDEGGFMLSSMVNKPAYLYKLNQGIPNTASGGQRGYQFIINDKTFLVYLKKFPLYTQKYTAASSDRSAGELTLNPTIPPTTAGGAHTTSFYSARNSDISSRNLNKSQISQQSNNQPNTATSQVTSQIAAQAAQKRPFGQGSVGASSQQTATARIEEDKAEDEDDSIPPSSANTPVNMQMTDPSGGLSSTKTGLKGAPKIGGGAQFGLKKPPPLTGAGGNNPFQRQSSQLGQTPPFIKTPKDVSPMSQASNRSSTDGGGGSSSLKGSFNFNANSISSKKPSVGNLPTMQQLAQSTPPENISVPIPPVSPPKMPTFVPLPPPLPVFVQSPLADDLKTGEAMVMGTKVNYEAMSKEKGQETLNSLLSNAFNFLPPPPPK